MSKTLSQVYYFDSGKKHITSLFKKQLVSLFEEYNLYNREVIILCIGSDRSTGREWKNPENYDLCLNTGKFDYETCVDIIENYIKTRLAGNN